MSNKNNSQAKGNEPQELSIDYFSLESVLQLIKAFPEEIEAFLTGMEFKKGRALEGNFPLSQSVIEYNEKNIPGYSAANHFARISVSGNEYVRRRGKAGLLSLVETVNAYFGRHIAQDGSFVAMEIGFTKHRKSVVPGCKLPVF